jgi:hypothetical protein
MPLPKKRTIIADKLFVTGVEGSNTRSGLDSKISLRVFAQLLNIIVAERIRVGWILIKLLDAISVVAVQAEVGPYP